MALLVRRDTRSSGTHPPPTASAMLPRRRLCLNAAIAPLASVLTRMLSVPDTWNTFCARYLAALDEAARAEATAPRIYGSWGYGDAGYRRREQASNLAEWHGLLLDRLADSEAEDHLDRLVGHPALDGAARIRLGPMQALKTRLAWLRVTGKPLHPTGRTRALILDFVSRPPGTTFQSSPTAPRYPSRLPLMLRPCDW
jgi:hypothetical protein